MAKEIVKKAKLQFMAGQAKPGPALAGVGINMPEFTKAFNDKTRDRGQEPVPVLITVYKDKSFDFKLFTAPTSFKLVQAAKAKKEVVFQIKKLLELSQLHNLKKLLNTNYLI